MEMKLLVAPSSSAAALIGHGEEEVSKWKSMSRCSSNCSTPYISAPSSPDRHHQRPPFNFFFCSAPTSPRSSSSSSPFNTNEDELPLSSSPAEVPFLWEHKPGVPKSPLKTTNSTEDDDEEEDYEFEFSGQLDMMIRPSLSSADELFDGGKIRPLKPPPALHLPTTTTSSDSPKSPKSSKLVRGRGALSPRHQRRNSCVGPHPPALQLQTTNATPPIHSHGRQERVGEQDQQERGRLLNNNNSNSRSRKGISRSLSPLRVSEFALLHGHGRPLSNSNSDSSSSSSSSASRKWRLKDLFLFRSASEGRASTSKDPLRNYLFPLFKKTDSDAKFCSTSSSTCSSFRSTADDTGGGSVSKRSSSSSRSPHELHYTSNRAVSDDLKKKKTSLPYKHNTLFACLGFNPALQSFSKAFPSFPPPE